MTAVAVTTMFLVGTFIQMGTSLKELGPKYRPAIDEWNAEDALIAEIPSWRYIKQWSTRIGFWRDRDAEIHRHIKHLTWVFSSWLILVGAAGLAFADAVVQLF